MPPVDASSYDSPAPPYRSSTWPQRLAEAVADRVPLALRGGRLALSPAAGAGLILVAVVAAALTAWSVWHGRPQAVSVSARPASTAAAAVAPLAPSAAPSAVPVVSPSASPTPPTGRVVIDVAGRVRHPGVATLAAGTRVIDALTWAGGVLPGTETTSVDLARPLLDGEQVYFGPAGGGAAALPPAAGTSGSPAAASSAGPIDLNAATASQLDALPGVGPVLAGRIIDYRTAHGRFTSTDELRQVQGLGGKKFDTLRPLVRV